jgi:hypothetical protein
MTRQLTEREAGTAVLYLDLDTHNATLVRETGDDSITITGVYQLTADDAVWEATGGEYSLVDYLHPDHGWKATDTPRTISHVLER